MNRVQIELPTTWAAWRLIGAVSADVLSRPVYAVLGVFYAVAGLTVFVFARNVSVVKNVLLGSGLPISARFEIAVAMYPGMGPAFTFWQSLVLVGTAVLVGVNLALLTFHLRRNSVSFRDGAGTSAGVLLGMLGAGCASCGSLLLAGLLSVVGASGLLTLLPLEGVELSLLAAATLVLSTYWIAVAIRETKQPGCRI